MRIWSFILLLAAAPAIAQPLGTVIENGALKVQYISPDGYFSLISKPSRRAFISHGTLQRAGGVAKTIKVSDKNFGQGQAIEVSYDDGNKDQIILFPNLPFALFRSSIHNGRKETSITRKIKTFTGTVDFGKPASQLKTLGTGGLLAPDKNPGSYVWLAVAEPESRNGVVFGWLTENRGCGVVFSKVDNANVQVDAQIDYGKLRIAPGKSEELETLAIGYFDDARLGLESWADSVAKVHNIKLPPQPAGYCTWYSQPYGGASDEKHIAEQSEFAAKHLAPFGFSVIQIDDKWQAGWKRSSPSSPKKNFTTHDPNGPYPSGMKAAADKIKSLGLVPGIWFMPFAGTAGDPFFDKHPEWFAKTADGKPYDTPWGGTCLDMTHPGARAHLRDVASRICRDWGYDYIKVDGLWTGTATKQLYINDAYKEDDIGEAVFHNPEKTNIEVYRDGLKLLRETVGNKVYILGCNGPQNMRSYAGAFGLVDGMRIGPDNKAEPWKSLIRGPVFGSRHYFLHGRVWHNDPDPVYVREKTPLNHAQLICSWVTINGQLNLSSEWFPGLPPERVDILKRTMPNHGLLPRPADLFENSLPSLWLLTDSSKTPRRDVIGVFNWESNEQKFDYPLDKLGLDSKTEYIAFDFWQNTLVPSVKGCLQLTVPGETCRVLAVRPRANHPLLISTSRHITQGIVDVMEEKWDGTKKTLSGRSKVVGGDPYELRIVVPSGTQAEAIEVAKADGTKASFTQDQNLLRAKIDSAKSDDVSWTVRFK